MIKLVPLGHFKRLDIDQFALIDERGATRGGITVGIEAERPDRAYLMGFHLKDGSPLTVVHALARRYPLVRTTVSYRAPLGRYVERRVKRPKGGIA